MEHPDPSNLQNPNFFNTGLRSVRLKPGKDRQTIGRHPWILDSSVVESISPPRLGEQVDVIGGDGKWIGRGLHDPTHRIRVRVYTWSPEQAVDGKLIQNRIEQAIELRRRLLPSLGSNAIRWIYSESDGLSGLIVDEFAEIGRAHV